MAITRIGCFGVVAEIDEIADAGFDYIELNMQELVRLTEAEFCTVCEKMKKRNLGADICSWILPVSLDLTSEETNQADWIPYLETGAQRCSRLGVQAWIIGSGKSRSLKPENGSEKEQRARLLLFFALVDRIAASHGITTALEPLGPAFSNYLNTLESCVDFIQEIPDCSMKTMCDLRHMVHSQEPLSQIERYSSAIIHAHIDYPLGDKRLCPLPTDGYDYLPYIKYITKIGIERLSIENMHDDHTNMKLKADYLRKLSKEAI